MSSETSMTQKLRWPNFFIIGAGKSGTTSLYHYLNQHPEIFMSTVKEPMFFALASYGAQASDLDPISQAYFQKYQSRIIQSEETYKSLFQGVQHEKAIGEASPQYFYFPETAKRIYEKLPASKLILVLRNPFDAACSHFLADQKEKKAPSSSLLETFRNEDLESENPFKFPYYIRYRFYDTQLSKYLEYFPKDQILILLHEDLKTPQLALQSIFRFLDVDDQFAPDTTVWHNTTKRSVLRACANASLNVIPQNIRSQLPRIIPNNLFEKYMNFRTQSKGSRPSSGSRCPEEAKTFLRPILEPRIQNLEKLIERDLSHWYS